MDDAREDLLPVRMLNEYAYCPRLFHLMHVEGRWADNVFTLDGKQVHRRVDQRIFYCELNAQERILMEGGLKEVIHHDDDQVLILDLGQGAAPLESALHTLGKTYVPPCRVQVV